MDLCRHGAPQESCGACNPNVPQITPGETLQVSIPQMSVLLLGVECDLEPSVALVLVGPLHVPRRVRRARGSFRGHRVPPAEPGHCSRGRPGLEERCAVQRAVAPRPAPRPRRGNQRVQNHCAKSAIPQLPCHQGENCKTN